MGDEELRRGGKNWSASHGGQCQARTIRSRAHSHNGLPLSSGSPKHPFYPIPSPRSISAAPERYPTARVRLEFDQANAHIGHKDKYKLTLAYVFIEDGTFLNAEIVKQGYGHAYTRFPFKYLEEFRQLEQEAREKKKGLWGKSS
ncbi:MAG: thermonuclease family protein [Desulfatiglandales bacterium]